jgi:hypothetical protein
MKKVLLAAVIAGLAGSIASAQTNVVTSANVVGYVKLTVPSNSFSMVAGQFINTSQEDMTIDELFGTSLPDGTELYVFDMAYTTYTYADGIGWLDEAFGDAGSVVISRGQAVWIKNITGSPIDIFVAGNVPGNDFPNATNNLPEGFAMVSGSYPTDVTLATLGITPADGDEIYVYNNGYTTYTYADGIGWLDEAFGDAGSVVINVGNGFWYKGSATNQWVQSKPYADF